MSLIRRTVLCALLSLPVLPSVTLPAHAETLIAHENDARMIINEFFDDSQQAALTQKVRPTRADLEKLYQEPVVTNLLKIYEKWFAKGQRIGPKERHRDIITNAAWFADLRKQTKRANAFAGGHGKLAKYMKATEGFNPPVIRFSFVRSGEKKGLAFDSLYLIDGRWVLIPKPWRGVP